MRRPNKATVEDSGLGSAFAEGLNEGFRLTGYVLLLVKVGGHVSYDKVIKASEVCDTVAGILAGMRGEHYDSGVVIQVIAESEGAPESAAAEVGGLPEGEDSSIDDAEVVED